MKGDRRFVASMLLPTFFFLICFYAYPTLYNLMNSFTDLSLFGMRKGGAWVGFENYWELVTSRDFRNVLWNTIVWLTFIGVSVRILLGLALAFLLTSRTIRKYRLQTISRVLLLALDFRRHLFEHRDQRFEASLEGGPVPRIAFGRDLLAAGSPTRTLTPLSRRFSACAWPCEP